MTTPLPWRAPEYWENKSFRPPLEQVDLIGRDKIVHSSKEG